MTPLDAFLIQACVVVLIVSYIVLKITEPNFGIINWHYIFKCLAKKIRKLFR